MKSCPTCQHTYPDDVEFCPRDGAHLTAQATATEAQLASGLSRRFRHVRRLAQGGFGTVFLAEQIGVGNRPVALKVLNRKLLDDPDFLLRFQNEAGSTGRIHHPNVVTIHESGQADDGTPYIAMEFLEGESLRETLTRRGALPVTEVAEILQQAARGLNAAHKLGIIHRDLKPDNIFLTRGDEGETVVKVVDFGIAKLRESAMHTPTSMVLGTPPYMSSEQAYGMRSDELDARSDVYSLGVVAYEMLTGRLPFHSDTPAGYLRKHMLEPPPPFRAVAQGSSVPPRVEAVVMKALKKEREERYQSILEFAHAFEAAALPAAEVAQPLPSTKVVVLPAMRELGAPVPQSSTTPAQADIAAPTPPPSPPERIAEAPAAQPQASKAIAAASRPPTGAEPPRFWTVWRPPSKKRLAALAGVALVLIVAGGGYYSRHAVKKAGASLSAKAGPSQGEVRVNPKDGLKYVWIPPGTFMMGCSPGDAECADNERPLHQVTITKGFWLGQTEVTVGAYKRFAATPGRAMPIVEPAIVDRPLNAGWRDEAMPMVVVDWDEAQDYCHWAGGRLPTEAEWEYAARAGSTEARYGPLDDVAWYADNSGRKRLDSARIWKEDKPNYKPTYFKRVERNGDALHEVGRKRANGLGLYDMLGNVFEWVNDWYDEKYYQNSPSRDPAGPTSGMGLGDERVLRGGSWSYFPGRARASYREAADHSYINYDIGFRCGGEVFAP